MAASAPYTSLLRAVSAERFAELLAPLNRQSKERYFARHHVRAAKVVEGAFVKPGQKNAERAQKLHAALCQQEDEPLAEELLRLYLLHRRALLEAALDYLGIAHEGGLTESPDLIRFSKLTANERAALKEHLVAQKGQAEADVDLYLDFMGQSTLGG